MLSHISLSDPSLTLSNMLSALDSLSDTEWEEFGLEVNVPLFKLEKIRSQFNSDGERKDEVFRIYLTEHPYPTWKHVSEALYNLGDDNEQCHSALDRLQSMFPTGVFFLSLSLFSTSCFNFSPSCLQLNVDVYNA